MTNSYALDAKNEDMTKILKTEKSIIHQNSQKTLTHEQYVWGSFASIIPGFGIGHASSHYFRSFWTVKNH